MATILIIDDEEHVRETIFARMEELGHTAFSADTIVRGQEHLNSEGIDLVFLDVNLPDGNGLELLNDIKESEDPPLVIIITAFGNTSGAKLAIHNGAWDYIEKPFYKEKLLLQTKRALDYRNEKKKRERRKFFNATGLIGKSRAFLDCIEKAADSADSTVNVLIQGESGTGKEILARLIHENSPAKDKDYVVVDCAALPTTLMESALFGHEKGAFTSADKSANGLIALADQGTLFLDEIGELSLSAQKKFLRVLQEKTYRPVGSTRELKSRFRLISATNRDLKTMVAEGRFREDLFHRISTYLITVPPLRERRGDIKDLAIHYLDKSCATHHLPPKVLLPETIGILTSYHWPGNVRELVNVVERAALTDPEMELIYPMQLPGEIRLACLEKDLNCSARARVRADIPLTEFKSFRTTAIEDIEQTYFERLLYKCHWDLDMAAETSGLSKNRIYHYIRKFDLKSAD